LSPARTPFQAAGTDMSGLRYAGPTVAHPEPTIKTDINANSGLERPLVDAARIRCPPETYMGRLLCVVPAFDSKLRRDFVKRGYE
jgi:hypothetical protein